MLCINHLSRSVIIITPHCRYSVESSLQFSSSSVYCRSGNHVQKLLELDMFVIYLFIYYKNRTQSTKIQNIMHMAYN